MSSEFQMSVTVLIVGMIAVFFILMLVVLVARSVILITNRWSEEEKALIKGSTIRASTDVLDIPEEHSAVLRQVVSQLTKGKGRIVSIKSKRDLHI